MKADLVYRQHIVDAILKIESYISVGQELFMRETHWQDAVIRQLQVIGEATKRLSLDLRSRHPVIPWRRIAGMQDILIHDYMGVDLAAVWEVAQKDFPNLKRQVEDILREMKKMG